MSIQGFSKQDELINKLKNCLGALPKQQIIKSEIKNVCQSSYHSNLESIPSSRKQSHNEKQQYQLLDNYQSSSQDLKTQNINMHEQLYFYDKHKKRNQYYEQKIALEDITNFQYSSHKKKRYQQIQSDYSIGRRNSKFKATYTNCFNTQVLQHRRNNTERYKQNIKDPSLRQTNQRTFTKKYKNQFVPYRQSSYGKQNLKKQYEMPKPRVFDFELKSKQSKQTLKCNENNIGSIRKKKRQYGKITDHSTKSRESNLQQSKILFQQQKFYNQAIRQDQQSSFSCKKCGCKDNNFVSLIGHKLNQQEKTIHLNKINQLNDRINFKINNIVEKYKNSTENSDKNYIKNSQ